MADVSVRPARPEDAERVARVQLSTWRTAYAELLPADALDVPEERAAALWLVAFAASGPATDDGLDPTTTVELLTLLVEPRWGRRGHGSRLVAASVEHWRGAGFSTAVAWAFERDAATRGFLTGSGWEPDGSARGLDTGARVQRQLRFHTDLREVA